MKGAVIVLLMSADAWAGPAAPVSIKLNQIGCAPDASKVAVVPPGPATTSVSASPAVASGPDQGADTGLRDRRAAADATGQGRMQHALPQRAASTVLPRRRVQLREQQVAINWNAPLVYVSTALDVMTYNAGQDNMESTKEQERSHVTLARQEQVKQFPAFTNTPALEIGLALVAKARAAGKSVAVDITRHGASCSIMAWTAPPTMMPTGSAARATS